MAVSLIALSPAEFAGRRPAMVADFAREMTDNFGMPAAEARTVAERQSRELLPEGERTPGHLLRKAVADGAEVGFLWLSLPGTFYTTMAWVSEIDVLPRFQSRGYGTQMMLAGEADLLGRGVHRLGLHVFGRNDGARRLYERLGYQVLSQVRARAAGNSATPARAAGNSATPARAAGNSATPGRAAGNSATPGRAAGNGAAPALELIPMTDREFAVRVAGVVEHDPIVLTRDPGAGADRARQIVRTLAPRGVRGEGVFARVAMVGGERVGWIWFALPAGRLPTTGMVHYLAVDEGKRRRGHGRAMIAAAAAELARHGVPNLGLNLSGSRPEVIRVADALGFSLLSQQMVKDLSAQLP